jgi:predicted TIM-barrel fold metal-dependent hydrolase
VTYAGDRFILDADSHLMELPGFLDGFVEPSYKDRLLRDRFAGFQPLIDRASERSLDAKGWSALGASDPLERCTVLDEMGFQAQLVFPTFASVLYRGAERDLLYAGISAQNRALAEFCSVDERLLAVGFAPLSEPEKAVELAEEATEAGCAAIMVPSTAAGERAPTHPDLDPFWSFLQQRGVPFVLHVGGGGRLLDPAFHNNSMPVTDHLGGGENVRSKDALAIHHSPSVFLGALVLDGLFDRFPGLRGGCIEQGAGWVVSWLHQLDHLVRSFRRTEPPLTRLPAAPSDYVRRHLRFTPFPGEPVGWMIEQAGAELFMFSSDYPHPEGGRDPLAKFEAAMEGVDEAAKERFYAGNMAWLMGRPAGDELLSSGRESPGSRRING